MSADRFIRHRALLTGVVVLLLAGGAARGAGEPVVVVDGNLGPWQLTTTGSGGPVTASLAFVQGPGTPPAGIGSLEFSVGSNGNGAAQARNPDYHGVLLADLTELSYWSYVQQWVDGQVVYVLLSLDLDGDLVADDLLFFEPAYQSAVFFPSNPQGPPALGTWQLWDARNGGWWSVSGIAGASPGTGVKSIADYLAVEPDARIVNTATGQGGMRFVAGFGAGAWDGFVGNVDLVTIGVSGTVVCYDFDKDVVAPSVDCGVRRSLLWPATRGLVDVGLAPIVTDADPAPAVSVFVYSDEPAGAAPYAPDATYDGTTLRLRAERDVTSNGRVYLVVVEATDSSGNVGRDVCTVVVPLNLTVQGVSQVRTEAADATAYAEANGGLPPPGYVALFPGTLP